MAQPKRAPEREIATIPTPVPPVALYGLTRFSDLFSARQLVALATFSDLIQEARERVKRDALATGLPDDGQGLDDDGTGAQAYGDAASVCIGML